jgi:hypothetical protein
VNYLGDMSLNGRIEDFSLTEILRLIQTGKKSGALFLEDGENKGAVLFKDGKVIFAFMGSGDIGHKLVNCKLISPETLKFINKAQEEGDNGIIKTLIKQNFVTEDKLRKFLENHTKDILGDLFSWAEGDFDFLSGQKELLDDFSIGQQIDIDKAIGEAKEKLDIWVNIKKVIPDSRAVISLSPDGANGKDEVVLSEVEWKIISEVNGNRSVSEIVSNCGMDKFSVSKILVELAKGRMITVSPYKPEVKEIIELPKVEPVIHSNVLQLAQEKTLEKEAHTEKEYGQGMDRRAQAACYGIQGQGFKQGEIKDTTPAGDEYRQPDGQGPQKDNRRLQSVKGGEIPSGNTQTFGGQIPQVTGSMPQETVKSSTYDLKVDGKIDTEEETERLRKNNELRESQDIKRITENFKGKKDVASISLALEELQLLSKGNKNSGSTQKTDNIPNNSNENHEKQSNQQGPGLMKKFLNRK